MLQIACVGSLTPYTETHGIDLDMVSRSDAKLNRSNKSPPTHDCGQGDTFGTKLGCTLPSLTTNACRQPDWLPLTAPWNKPDAPTKYDRWLDCWLQLQLLQHSAWQNLQGYALFVWYCQKTVERVPDHGHVVVDPEPSMQIIFCRLTIRPIPLLHDTTR